MADRLKCSRQGWCRRLDERLAPEANAHAKGLTTVVVTTLSTGEDRCIGIAYKLDARDNGMMVNFCPWCGEDIQFWETKPDLLVPDKPRRVP